MSEDHLERHVLGRVGMDRRSFIKKLVVGAAFAVPAIASFDMLASSTASGQTCTSANGGTGTSGTGTTGGAGGTRRRASNTEGSCGGTPDGGTGGSGTAVPSDRALKTAVAPVLWD